MSPEVWAEEAPQTLVCNISPTERGLQTCTASVNMVVVSCIQQASYKSQGVQLVFQEVGFEAASLLAGNVDLTLPVHSLVLLILYQQPFGTRFLLHWQLIQYSSRFSAMIAHSSLPVRVPASWKINANGISMSVLLQYSARKHSISGFLH